MLTAAIFEGLAYGELKLREIPYTIYDGTHTYVCAIPLTYFLQYYLLNANLALHLPASLSGLWW